MAIKIGSVSKVPEGKGIVVTTESGLQIALFKINGQIIAMKNECPHMQGPLGEGELEGTTLTCPWHGWQFNCLSGECLTMPGEETPKIRIKVEDDDIYLE